jgi:DNA-binding MarR family transcriptional regulator
MFQRKAIQLAKPSKDDERTRPSRFRVRLFRCTQAVKIQLRVLLDEEFATTLPQWDMVATLARGANGMSMSQLSKALMVTNGSVTNVVNRLLAEKLVVKKAVIGDRRTARIQLTPKGWKFYKAVAAANERWMENMLEHVKPSDIDQLNVLLGSICDSIDLTRRSFSGASSPFDANSP